MYFGKFWCIQCRVVLKYSACMWCPIYNATCNNNNIIIGLYIILLWCVAIMQAKLLLSFEEVLRTFRLQHRFALQYKVVKPFEKLRWYGKLNLRLWGGEQYCSRSSLEKVINSQNCKVIVTTCTSKNCMDLVILPSGWNRELEWKSDINFGIEGTITKFKVNINLWCSLHGYDVF